MSGADETNQTTAQDNQSTNNNNGIVRIDYLKKPAGILNIVIIVSLLLGFICAVSLSHSDAKFIDQHSIGTVKVNVASSRASYAVFSFLGIIAFAVLLLINSINIPMFRRITNILTPLLTIAIIGAFIFLMFILSATAAASEQKLRIGIASVTHDVRPGGMGAASFFGFVSVVSMAAMAFFTFTSSRSNQ